MTAAGDRVGDWTLLEALGSGGNAEVWRAKHASSGTVAALKLLRVRNPGSERYRRFRDEIRVHQLLAGTPGLLPLLDHSLPDHPSRVEPAWLAMPEATLIRDALAEADLHTTVAAMASIAATLASLAERRIHHRDVKPENLYKHG